MPERPDPRTEEGRAALRDQWRDDHFERFDPHLPDVWVCRLCSALVLDGPDEKHGSRLTRHHTWCAR